MPGISDPFVTRYLAGELSSFFALPPNDVAAALSRPLERPRQALAAALRSEAERLGAPAAAAKALERLSHPNSRVVVTGQQPGLLLGPAYAISKAITAIRLARELDSEEAPVVPVFWVAAQDHDTAEIDHAHLLDEDEKLHRLRLELPDRVASGSIPFRHEWTAYLAEEMQRIGRVPEHAAAATRLLEDGAAVASSFADLFAAMLWKLLGDQGLLLLDPSRPALAALFAPVLEHELEEPRAGVDAIVAAGEELRRLGLEPQLGRGQGATNLFVEEQEGGLPRRALLRFDGEGYATAHRRYGFEELRSILCAEPWRLTPAAGLRPVVQDAVLPTAVFVVGPGELRYVAQLAGVYAHHDVQMPLVHPRASSVVLEPPVRRILGRFELDYRRFVAERGRALERVLLARHGHAEAFEHALQRLEAECAELGLHVRRIDPTLVRSVARCEYSIRRRIELLREKSGAAVARRDSDERRQFDRLEAHLFPSGAPQERVLSPFSFFLKFGIEPMKNLYLGMGATGEHLLEP